MREKLGWGGGWGGGGGGVSEIRTGMLRVDL